MGTSRGFKHLFIFSVSVMAFCWSLPLAASKYPQLYRPDAKTLMDKAFEYEITGSLFQTTGLYDSDGTEFVLNDNESNLVMESDLTLRYGLSDNLQLEGGLRFRQVMSEYSIGNEDFSTSASGAESYYFGLKYSQKSSTRLTYSLDAWARQTAYDNEVYENVSQIPEDEIILGDSGSSYYAGASISYMRTKDHYLNASGGYHQPANELSAEMPWDLNTVWTWDQFALELGAEGIYSFGADEYGENPSLKPRQGRGVSNLYNSVNRQWMAPKAAVYYAFGAWRLGFHMASRMSGVSTDKGTEFMISLLKASKGKSVTKKIKEKFKEYRIESTVLKVSPRGRFIRIDQGLSQDVEKGMQFDIYQTDFFGGNELVATAVAFEVGLQKSILKVVKFYSSKRVKKGFVARAQ